MVADALAPYLAKSSTAMILTMSNRLVLVLYEEGFLCHVTHVNVDQTKEYVYVPSEKFSTQRVNYHVCVVLRGTRTTMSNKLITQIK